jgi:hypothetical protein
MMCRRRAMDFAHCGDGQTSFFDLGFSTQLGNNLIGSNWRHHIKYDQCSSLLRGFCVVEKRVRI